jgi:hypothetical protein
MARRILAELGDRGNRAARRKTAVAAPLAVDDEDNRPTLVPPPAPELDNAAIPLTRRSGAKPPPLPTAEEFARQREQETVDRTVELLKLRYPVFGESTYENLATAIARNAIKQTGDNSGARYDALVRLVAQTVPALEGKASFQPIISGIRAADAVLWELEDRWTAFKETEWQRYLPSALAAIFRVWQIGGSKLENAPDGRTLIPEADLEEGFSDFTSNLARDHPDVESGIFYDAFVEGDSGPRDKRWTINIDPESDPDIVVSNEPAREAVTPPAPAPSVPSPLVSGTLEIPPPATTSDAPASAMPASNVSHVRRRPEAGSAEEASAEILRRYPALEAHPGLVRTLAERAVRTASDPSSDPSEPAVERTLADLLRALADTAPPKTPRAELLRALIEKDLSEELADRYGIFQEPSFAKLKAVMARRIYDVWDGNNRTFNGTASVLPLRVPEKFVDEGMNALLTPLRASDPELADRIMRSYRGTRAERAERRTKPTAVHAVRPIPISQDNVLIELRIRFPRFFATYEKLGAAFAKDVYNAWLEEDPDRTLEQSGPGLRGIIPETVLERRLPVFYARMEQSGHAALVRAMKDDDKGPRSKRGTAVLEFDILSARTG